jgi:hypothetical protein
VVQVVIFPALIAFDLLLQDLAALVGEFVALGHVPDPGLVVVGLVHRLLFPLEVPSDVPEEHPHRVDVVLLNHVVLGRGNEAHNARHFRPNGREGGVHEVGNPNPAPRAGGGFCCRSVRVPLD